MNRFLFRLTAVFLMVCCVVPFTACNENSVTPGTSATVPSDSDSDPETTRPVEILTSNRTETSVCFVGEYEEDPTSLFYDSPQEAISAHPTGASITFCADYTTDKPLVLPEGVDYAIDYNWYRVDFPFETGLIYEYAENHCVNFIYYTSLAKMYKDRANKLHKRVVWFFGNTEGYTPGKYLIINIHENDAFMESEYELKYSCGIENWKRQYVATCDGVYYYTLQEAVDGAKLSSRILIDIIADYSCDDVIRIPYNGCSYRIAYNWMHVNLKFDHGITYDDCGEPHGYAYYSDYEWLCSQFHFQDTYAWVWTDEEGYKPGKYYISLNEGLPDAPPDENGNIGRFSIKNYTFTWVDTIDNFNKIQYGDLYDQYFPDGE